MLVSGSSASSTCAHAAYRCSSSRTPAGRRPRAPQRGRRARPGPAPERALLRPPPTNAWRAPRAAARACTLPGSSAWYQVGLSHALDSGQTIDSVTKRYVSQKGPRAARAACAQWPRMSRLPRGVLVALLLLLACAAPLAPAATALRIDSPAAAAKTVDSVRLWRSRRLTAPLEGVLCRVTSLAGDACPAACATGETRQQLLRCGPDSCSRRPRAFSVCRSCSLPRAADRPLCPIRPPSICLVCV